MRSFVETLYFNDVEPTPRVCDRYGARLGDPNCTAVTFAVPKGRDMWASRVEGARKAVGVAATEHCCVLSGGRSPRGIEGGAKLKVLYASRATDFQNLRFLRFRVGTSDQRPTAARSAAKKKIWGSDPSRTTRPTDPP